MHIGIVSPEFPPGIGGVETYAYEYTKALTQLGHTATVFTSVDNEAHIYTETFSVQPVLRIRRRLDSPILRGYAVDAWHVMNAAYSWLAVDADRPVVISVHGNDFLRPYLNTGRPDLFRFRLLWRFKNQLRNLDKHIGHAITRSALNRSINKAAHILTNSRYTEKVFLERFPACRGMTTPAMVGLGSDFTQREHLENTTGRPRLITISRLSEPRKNIDLVLKALARLKDDYEFLYTIIGDGHFRHDLEDLCERLGLREQVEFLGFVEKDKLMERLLSSDLFILTSSILPVSHEGFGIVYLEAAACGTPSLAANLAGAAEAVKDGTSGYFVQEANVASIEVALKQHFDNSVPFDTSSCQAFARSFTWQSVAETALPFYV